jgi:predicted GNAT family acetyltransferase
VVSAVCTHPEVRGRGLAATLTAQVAHGIIGRGELPFLHVKDDNHGAIRVYERLGFTTRREATFNLVTAPQSMGSASMRASNSLSTRSS